MLIVRLGMEALHLMASDLVSWCDEKLSAAVLAREAVGPWTYSCTALGHLPVHSSC